MADIVIRASYASVVEEEEEAALFIGFAEGEDDDEPFALFRQPLGGGPVWFAVNDADMGAEDALLSVTRTAKGLDIAIKPEFVPMLGFAKMVTIRIGPECEDADDALAALAEMLGPVYR